MACQPVAIINLTPDSFSDGGQWGCVDAVLNYAHQLWAAGVTWWDVGAESTRPGAECLPADIELSRLMPGLTRLRDTFPQATISVDTRKAAVAEAALALGIQWVNDVSGLTFDPAMAETIARYQAGVMIMHSQGTPDIMQDNPQYQDVVAEVQAFLQTQAAMAQRLGITQIILDPGFGFGKSLDHNLALHRSLPQLVKAMSPIPVMTGTSRKRFLTLGQNIPTSERDGLTAISTALAYQAGVQYVRVHNALDAQRQLAWLNALAGEAEWP